MMLIFLILYQQICGQKRKMHQPILFELGRLGRKAMKVDAIVIITVMALFIVIETKKKGNQIL